RRGPHRRPPSGRSRMSFKPVVSVLALALLAACGQDVTPPENTATGGAATAPVAPAAQDVDPSRVDVPPGTRPMLVREGPGHLADASGAALYYLEGDGNGSRCEDDCMQVCPPVTLD